MAVLEREAIRRLVQGDPPLVSGYLDLESQLQPHGLDLTLRSVEAFLSEGGIGREERRLPGTRPVAFDGGGWLHLPPGAYLITFNEVVSLPPGLMALAFPRSSLLRSGATVYNAVWDAGYSGRSRALLAVHNPYGLHLERGARVVQMVFLCLESPASRPYSGLYQGEE